MKLTIQRRNFDKFLEKDLFGGFMKCFVAVTRLLKMKPQKNGVHYYFHFKGVYEGLIVKGLIVESSQIQDLKRGDDYLLYLGFEGIDKGLIRARLIKMKALKSLTC